MHPIGDHYVLGIGQDATSTGRVNGTKVSLFDVSNLADPKEISSWKLAGSNSQAEFDHHAFLYWDEQKIAVLPINQYGGFVAPATDAPGTISGSSGSSGGAIAPTPIRPQQYFGAVVLSIDPAKGIGEVGRITHNATSNGAPTQILRSLVAADRIWTVSYGQMQANTFDDLAVTATIAL